MNKYEDLTRLYSLSKTLRFELKPIGKTLENIERKGLIGQDEKRAENYKTVKSIIDNYHKAFIRLSLYDFKLKLESDNNHDSLEEYVDIASISKRTPLQESEFDEVKGNLRKQIVSAFKSSKAYETLFKKELIQQDLPCFVENEEERQLVDTFSKFTTYFTGFHENRKNMYSEEEKSTAIAYRLINENLPLFIDNMKTFSIIAASVVAENFAEIERKFEDCLNANLIDMFTLSYFSKTLTQEQIDLYNYVIGGRVLDDGTKIQGINEYVNLYNQSQKEKHARLPLLKPLYKMILSDHVAISWLPESFSCDEEMLLAINSAYQSLDAVLSETGDFSLYDLLKSINEYDVNHIYLSNDLGLTDISQQIFGRYDIYSSAIKAELRNITPMTSKEKREPELFEERISRLYKYAKSFSIGYLNTITESDKTIQDYYTELGAYDRNGIQQINLFRKIEMAHFAAADVLAGKVSNLNQSEQSIKLIKDFLDSIKSLQRYIKPLLGNGDEADKDNAFDARLRMAWDMLGIINPLYDKVRNWLTRKPYSDEKIKLNFENAQLLAGWDLNKEPDCTSILLCKEGNYYLAIMDKKANHAFDVDTLPCDGDCYKKVDYKYFKDVTTMIPKCSTQMKAVKSHFTRSSSDFVIDNENFLKPLTISKEVYDLNNQTFNGYKLFQKGYVKLTGDVIGYKTAVNRWIDFCLNFIESYASTQCYDLTIIKQRKYETVDEFYSAINNELYKLNYRDVSVEFIDNLVDSGKLYLFQIWNKDFSEHSIGTPNMHTLYWKMLFDKQNLSDVVFKLNGQAEVFYRKKSIKLSSTTVHKANNPIANKNVNNIKTKSIFDYDIVKNRRYTVDKFQFHVPITLNFKSNGTNNINEKVLEVIRNNGVKHIIGIDRGERHLLYLSLIDMKGNIIQQMTLNDIINKYKGNTYKTNYKDLLSVREGDRTEARRNWQKIENIKDLKEGYLSQVVHVIAQMMVEYHAIVVLEDLNMGFMQGRQRIERSVYEQFERKLIEKLNFYVDKRKDTNEIGGLLHALQLTSKFESFKKLGKQSGCLFYIPAWNTSKIDPVTGFVNLLDTRYENVEKARCFFSKFDGIGYNAEKDWFEFALDYNKFTTKAEGTKTKWVICTYGCRIDTFRNPAKLHQWDSREIVLTDEFKSLFTSAGIDILGNIKDQICGLADKKYLEPLMHLMKLMLQLRNSVTNSEIDYLLSPVSDDNGVFYDSRTCLDCLPKDADANGAYNIARKGLWVIRQIRQCADGIRPNLAISNKEWLNFAQLKPYLND